MPHPATEEDILRIYRETIDGLYGYVVLRCDGDRDLAEDIVQESWLRAVKAWAARGLPEEPGAWLTTVARNLLSNHYRRRPFEALDEGALEVATPPGPGRREARVSVIGRGLARLSAAQAALLHAFHFEHVPVAEIAASQGLSDRAVEGRLRRAREKLRTHIESDPDSEGEVP